MKLSARQTACIKAFLDLKRPFDPTSVYIGMCKLVGLTDEQIERGLGKLFREGKLKSPDDRPRRVKPSRGSRPAPDDFR